MKATKWYVSYMAVFKVDVDLGNGNGRTEEKTSYNSFVLSAAGGAFGINLEIARVQALKSFESLNIKYQKDSLQLMIFGWSPIEEEATA